MHLSRLAVVAVVAWGLHAGSLLAQANKPAAGQPVSFDYYYYQASTQPSPSDQQVTPVVQAPAATTCACPSDSCGCNDCCDCCGGILSCWPCGCLLEDLGEAWKLWEPCCECSQWSFGGWLAQSYVWNPYQPPDKFNGPLTWTDRANEYQMNELYTTLVRTADTGGCGWDWGFRGDALLGTNYRWCTSGGFETDWEFNSTFYGLAIPNLYGELAYNDLSVKAGRMTSPVGYYAVGTNNNFFPVLPYTFQYGEPFTHTGIHATYKYTDDLTLGLAVIHGWDNTDNRGNPYVGWLGTGTYTLDECRSLAYVGIIGNEPNFSGVNPAANGLGYTQRYLQTLVYVNKLSDDVTFVLQSDYGRQYDAITAGEDAEWYGLNSYLYWNQTCQLQWGLNMEWFRDDGGFRVGQVLPSFGSPDARGFNNERGPTIVGAAGTAGFDGSFYRMTFGPKYYFTPNFYTRIAAVLDWYDGDADVNTGDLPFDDGTKDHQEVMVFDLILTF